MKSHQIYNKTYRSFCFCLVFCPLSVIASICAFIGAGKVCKTGIMDAKQFLITVYWSICTNRHECYVFQYYLLLFLSQKKPELLLPLLILLSFSIVLTIVVIVGLIAYYLLNEIKGREGLILTLSYDTVVIPLPISLAICFGSKL